MGLTKYINLPKIDQILCLQEDWHLQISAENRWWNGDLIRHLYPHLTPSTWWKEIELITKGKKDYMFDIVIETGSHLKIFTWNMHRSGYKSHNHYYDVKVVIPKEAAIINGRPNPRSYKLWLKLEDINGIAYV